MFPKIYVSDKFVNAVNYISPGYKYYHFFIYVKNNRELFIKLFMFDWKKKWLYKI